MRHTTPATLLLLLALAAPGLAQEREGLPPPGSERLFGFEFEFAGEGNRIVNFETMPFENYKKLMEVVVRHYGGDPADITRRNFMKETSNLERYPSGQRALFEASWKDSRGREWLITPEFVASSGYDGYELVTPPLDDPAELEKVLGKVRSSGLVREGNLSGVHLTIDGRKLVTPSGNARALANLIVMHENLSPTLRRMFDPVRHGGHANRFGRSLSVDHPGLLEAIDRLPPEERTRERLEGLFQAEQAREFSAHEIDPNDPTSTKKAWKYREMNLAKVLQINPSLDGRSEVVEFRMFDLDRASTHRMEAEIYRQLVLRAEQLAAQGIDVRLEPRAAQPAGENPVVYNTPDDVREARAQAREMIESLGLEPERFESLIEEKIVDRVIPTESEFKRELEGITRGRVVHNGKAFTYGFELEGSGSGFARIAVPKDPAMRERWAAMSDAQKVEYYERVVGSNRHAVKQHFDLDLERYPHLDPNWKVEGTGNWEVRSLPSESVGETTDQMREIKRLTGKSAKGFHLHMRDNGVNLEALRAKGPQFADFLERSANWVWMQRARHLGTMTSMKSWSNARPTPDMVEKWAQVKSSGRSTIRTTVPSNGEYLDLEIRGLTLRVDDIERLAKIYTQRLQSLEFGPWEHSENPYASGGNFGGTAPESIRLDKHLADYMERVEGREMTPEMRRIADALQHEFGNRAKGSARTYSTNVATPLLPWAQEAALSESTRRDLRFAEEAFLRSVRFTADKVANGEYGFDIEYTNAKAIAEALGISQANAERFVELREAAGGKLSARELQRGFGAALASEGASQAELSREGLSRGAARDVVKLREALSQPSQLDANEVARQMRHKVKDWAKTQRVAEGLFESLLPRPGRGFDAETNGRRNAGFGPRRRSGVSAGPKIAESSVREVFESVRESAGARALTERSIEGILRHDRVRNAELEIVRSSQIDARTDGSKVRVTTGLLSEIDARAESFSPEERPEFRRRALGLILGHELAHVSGTRGEQSADAEAVRILKGSNLGRVNGVEVALSDRQLRETLKVFEAPSGASRSANWLYNLRSLIRYGSKGSRLENLRATARAPFTRPGPPLAERGLPLPGGTASASTVRASSPTGELGLSERSLDRSFTRGAEGAQGSTATRDRNRRGISELLEGRLGRGLDRSLDRTRGTRRGR